VTANQIYRVSAWSLIVGAVIAFISLLYSGLVFVGDPTILGSRPDYLWVNALTVVGVAMLLLGLPGWFGSRAASAGVIGLIGMICIFLTGLVFGVFLSLLQALIFPYLAAQAPQAVAGQGPPDLGGVFISGTILNVVGAVLLAITVLRSRAQPMWTGYVWIACAVMAVVSVFVSGPSATNVVTSVLGVASGLLLFVALFGFGADMLSRHGANASPGSPRRGSTASA
jgi:hypothetical protein